ncbi:MAG: hypothetical protein M3Y30_05190 [Gemmatimonadota bacterium]|nr:hypothetical protein [Gemmatimonadota bacterium]
MKRRTIARVIAVILLSYALSFVLVSSHKSEMTRYRSLGHEALLATLAKKRETDFSSSFGQGLVGIGVIVVLIELLTWIIELAINRIAPLHPPGTSVPIADASGTRLQ